METPPRPAPAPALGGGTDGATPPAPAQDGNRFSPPRAASMPPAAGSLPAAGPQPQSGTMRQALEITQRLQRELRTLQEQKASLETRVRELESHEAHLEEANEQLRRQALQADRARREAEHRWDERRAALSSKAHERDLELKEAHHRLEALTIKYHALEERQHGTEQRMRAVDGERDELMHSQQLLIERMEADKAERSEQLRRLEGQLELALGEAAAREAADRDGSAGRASRERELRARCEELEGRLRLAAAEGERDGAALAELRRSHEGAEEELEKLRVAMVKLYAKYQALKRPDRRLRAALARLQEALAQARRRARAYARRYRDERARRLEEDARRLEDLERRRPEAAGGASGAVRPGRGRGALRREAAEGKPSQKMLRALSSAVGGDSDASSGAAVR